MSYLRETQEWMASMLRQRRALSGDPRTVDAARLHFTGSDGLSPVEKLEIYRRQFWLRHTASLLEDYPALAGLLGQSDWERLVESYLDEIAPTSWTLRDLGRFMPAHVERSAWLPHPLLSVDMARLEWASVEIFDAADAPSATPADFAVDTEELHALRLEMNPAMALLKVSYPVRTLQRRISAGKFPLEIPPREPENLVLYRTTPERKIESAVVSDAAFELLALLRDGVPLVAACERLAARAPDSAGKIEEHAGEWFADFARHGWVVGVKAA